MVVSDLINEPDASRLIFGLRDTGYNFRMAAADIIDNSIAANADEVHVRIEITSDGRKYVYFGDNGDGMDQTELHAAMRYGAPERENRASLGKFGLGLKTASSSVCRNFALISKKNLEDSLEKLAWDLDHVEKTGRWEMRRNPVEPHEKEAFEELCGDKGTLVVWSQCDRILSKNYEQPGGSNEQKAIKRMVKKHLDGIVTAVVTGATTARSEGFNAVIQKIKSDARGFRNRERFRNAIYFHLGGLDLYPESLRA